MAYFLRPGRWRRQPGQFTEVDRSSPLARGLMAFWPFITDGFGSAGRVRDANRRIDLESIGDTKPAISPLGKVVSFDGNADYLRHLSSGDYVLTYATTVSVSLWLKTTQAGGDPCILSKKVNDAGGHHAYALHLGYTAAAGKPAVRLRQSVTPTFIDLNGTVAVNDGAWHHLCFTFGSDFICRLYIDGRLDATSSSGNAIAYDDSIGDKFLIGAESYSGSEGHLPLDGQVGAVGLWNRGLNAAEVNQLYVERWSILRPIQRRIISTPAATTGGFWMSI